ncbi:MAG: pseudouridine synthase [Eubacterium sp.]
MRLQKYMAQCGVASRRKSEEIIAQGKVTVNGAMVTIPGFSVDSNKDEVRVNGKKITENKKIYILLNKPKDCVSTSEDRHASRTVMELIPIEDRLFTVGRLDKDTEGLLILTNDGDLTFRLTHPSHEFEKTYCGLVKGMPNAEALEAFSKGVVIDDDGIDYRTAPAKIKILKKYRSTALVEMVIHEGKKRQIRKMCEAIGYPIVHLQRIAIGNIKLENLKVGEWRYLKADEIFYLKGELND